MRVLVIDTALGLCTAGVFEVDGDDITPLGVRSEAMVRGHQERLGGMVRDAAREAGGLSTVDRIGVTTGPGSFTGLRVGLAFAQGLGTALERPVIGVSTLDALADGGAAAATVGAVIDARRAQVYARFWRDGRPLGPAAALTIESAMGAVRELGPGATLIGGGAEMLAGAVADAAIVTIDGPRPDALARWAARAEAAAHPPRPLYLRAPDATPPTRLPGQPRSRPT